MSDKGKDIMDSIRVIITQMVSEESRLLGERSKVPEEERTSTRNLLIVLMSLSIVLGTIITLIISRVISDPLQDLSRKLEEISKGNFAVNLEETGKVQEVNLLSQSLNRIVTSMKLAVLKTGSEDEEDKGKKEKA